MQNRDNYHSHIGQDAWVAECFDHCQDGFFLDFGAFDGITISNTLMLEKQLKWKGLAVEPNPNFYKTLCAKRSCACINRALWKESREEMTFVDAHGLSSFEEFKDCDNNAERRAEATQEVIKVDTINPTELLERFKAPQYIHYMSLDVEGAEFDILEAIDLQRYKIALMTIEHNHNTPKQEKIREYLSQFNYQVVPCRNDDFFFNIGNIAALKQTKTFENPGEIAQRIHDTYEIRD